MCLEYFHYGFEFPAFSDVSKGQVREQLVHMFLELHRELVPFRLQGAFLSAVEVQLHNNILWRPIEGVLWILSN